VYCLAAFTSFAQPVPSKIGEWNGRPAWISATDAVNAEGHLRASAFETHDYEAHVRRAQKNRDGCQVYTGVTPDHFLPAGSLTDLTTNAKAIVVGTVAAMAQGFHYGLPGSLLRLSDVSYLKGEAPSETFFFYPYARIETADGFVCARPHATLTEPRIGDRFIVFVFHDSPVFEGRQIVFANMRREVIHESGKRIEAPQSLTSLTGTPSFDRVAREVERAVRAP
jgi:hypothetical protein